MNTYVPVPPTKVCPGCKGTRHTRLRRCDCGHLFYGEPTTVERAIEMLDATVAAHNSAKTIDHTLSQILSDMRHLRDTIAYCEGQILRKEIAIAEIMNSRQVREEAAEVTTGTGTLQ